MGHIPRFIEHIFSYYYYSFYLSFQTKFSEQTWNLDLRTLTHFQRHWPTFQGPTHLCVENPKRQIHNFVIYDRILMKLYFGETFVTGFAKSRLCRIIPSTWLAGYATDSIFAFDPVLIAYSLTISGSSLQFLLHVQLEIEAIGSKGPPIANGIWGIKWSRDRWRHVSPKGAARQYGWLSCRQLCFLFSAWQHIAYA